MSSVAVTVGKLGVSALDVRCCALERGTRLRKLRTTQACNEQRMLAAKVQGEGVNANAAATAVLAPRFLAACSSAQLTAQQTVQANQPRAVKWAA